ncbi:MAG: hypothetical protein PHF37_01215 [Phycisphaerae bacterium]|nr:hypothetical protein [Phycisphaerae bacterium]
MRYIITLIMVLNLFFPVFCAADMACCAEDANGFTASLTVDVINGTEGASAAADDTVTIQIYGHDQLIKKLDGVVDANSQIVFSDIHITGQSMAIAKVKHGGMMFSGHPAVITSDVNNVNIAVYVYEVSYDNSNLSAATHHMIIETGPDGLKISEYIQLKNVSDMAISSEQTDSENRPVVLKMMLPKEFHNFKSISYFDENALIVTRDGFYDTMAIPPGEYSAAFFYTLDIDRPTINITKKISLPTSDLIIFIEADGTRVEGLGQPDNTVSRSGGTSMTYYKISGLAKGDEVDFRIKGFNVAEKLPVEIILVMVFGVVIIFVILRLRTRRN